MENLTWAAIGLVAAVMIWKQRTEEFRPHPVCVRNIDELDPKRWAHDGTQPTVDKRGNRPAVVDKVARQLEREIR